MIWLLALIVIVVLIGGGWWGWLLVAGMLGAKSVRDKPGALESITQLMHSYDITPAEVETAFHAPASGQRRPQPPSAHRTVRTGPYTAPHVIHTQY